MEEKEANFYFYELRILFITLLDRDPIMVSSSRRRTYTSSKD